MKFTEKFSKLLDSNGLGESELCNITQVRPETARKWLKGKLLIGKKNFRLILPHLDLSDLESEELAKLHLQACGDGSNWWDNPKSLADELKKLVSKSSIIEVASSSGFSRQSLYGWTKGMTIPSEANLETILNKLQIYGREREKLFALQKKERLKKPHGFQRNSYSEDEGLIRKFFEMFPPSRIWESKFSHVSFFWDSQPVLVRLKPGNLENTFFNCCAGMRQSNASSIILIVGEGFINRHQETFNYYRISTMSEADFIQKYKSN